MKGTFLIITLLNFVLAFSQQESVSQIENSLVSEYGKTLDANKKNDYDTVQKINDGFPNYIKSLLASNPSTLTYPFGKLNNGSFYIATSQDGMFRIYSWDEWTGGSGHNFDNIFQFKAGNEVKLHFEQQFEGDFGVFYSKVYDVEIAGKMYYLSVYNSILSTKDSAQGVVAYTIENSQLKEAPVFKTPKKLLSRINVDFDFFSILDDHPERPVKLIYYDQNSNTLYIPLVDQDGNVKNKNLRYRLKDTYFEYTGIK